jgi:hypothetical protein
MTRRKAAVIVCFVSEILSCLPAIFFVDSIDEFFNMFFPETL